jgi:hypothetical protein
LSAESEILHEGSGRRTSETVAGFLSSIAIFMSLVGLAWHPLRLIVPSLAIALIAAAMHAKGRLQLAAVLICTACFFFGFTIAVIASKPLY